MKTLKLNSLLNNKLSDKSMNKILGSEGKKRCACVCAGDDDSMTNSNANSKHNDLEHTLSNDKTFE